MTDHGELVGIFTDRDAILKVAGQPSAGHRALPHGLAFALTDRDLP